MCPTTDRDFARAEADYLRPPTERAPRCPHCREGFDPEACDELSADAAAALGLRAGDVVCPVCADAARADAALMAAITFAARETWLLWGSKATVISPSHAATVRVLERSTDRGRDGFVSFGGAQ